MMKKYFLEKRVGVEGESGEQWERRDGGLCQGLVSLDTDPYKVGRKSAEGAQTRRTPVSSWRGYARTRPQEPWKYLDIYFAPPLVCSATQCIISCGGETRFLSGQRHNLKRLLFGLSL